jgi:hypothetical protein
MEEEIGNCNDCGKSTFIELGDYYMVTPEIWNQYGLGGSYWSDETHTSWSEDTPSGMLCMKDLERRMGRKLQLSDLTGAPINSYWLDQLGVTQ